MVGKCATTDDKGRYTLFPLVGTKVYPNVTMEGHTIQPLGSDGAERRIDYTKYWRGIAVSLAKASNGALSNHDFVDISQAEWVSLVSMYIWPLGCLISFSPSLFTLLCVAWLWRWPGAQNTATAITSLGMLPLSSLSTGVTQPITSMMPLKLQSAPPMKFQPTRSTQGWPTSKAVLAIEQRYLKSLGQSNTQSTLRISVKSMSTQNNHRVTVILTWISARQPRSTLNSRPQKRKWRLFALCVFEYLHVLKLPPLSLCLSLTLSTRFCHIYRLAIWWHTDFQAHNRLRQRRTNRPCRKLSSVRDGFPHRFQVFPCARLQHWLQTSSAIASAHHTWRRCWVRYCWPVNSSQNPQWCWTVRGRCKCPHFVAFTPLLHWHA